jgi:arylsulfatase B
LKNLNRFFQQGSNDASFRGSNQILTPNIDALAYNGIIFDRFYTPAMCTPSRSSLMTGKYPHSVGMQHWVIPADEGYGLGLNHKLMSNYFKEAGYRTHLVGKWHLGYFQRKYTPTYRGFDSFFGYYNGLIDYYNFTYVQPPYTPGYDLRKDIEVNYDVKPGTYATDMFTDEAIRVIKRHDETKRPLFLMLSHLAPHTGNDYDLLQAPKSEIDKFKYIDDPDRRKLAGLILFFKLKK